MWIFHFICRSDVAKEILGWTSYPHSYFREYFPSLFLKIYVTIKRIRKDWVGRDTLKDFFWSSSAKAECYRWHIYLCFLWWRHTHYIWIRVFVANHCVYKCAMTSDLICDRFLSCFHMLHWNSSITKCYIQPFILRYRTCW